MTLRYQLRPIPTGQIRAPYRVEASGSDLVGHADNLDEAIEGAAKLATTTAQVTRYSVATVYHNGDAVATFQARMLADA